jgi:general secretion pathway protein N
MSRLVLGLALALLLGITLLVSAPARLLNLLLPGSQVSISGFDGTLWQGSASRCLVRVGPGYLHLGAVQWSLDPWSLLLFAPGLTVSSTWGGQSISGDITVRGRTDIDLENFEASLAADVLRQFAPVALAGVLSVQLEQLQLRDGLPYSGAGRLVWREGAWQSPQGLLPLGSYALDFQQPAGEALRGEVLTLSGPVQAEGEVRLQGRDYSVNILVGSEAYPVEQLEQALSLIATPEPGGYRVRLEASL